MSDVAGLAIAAMQKNEHGTKAGKDESSSVVRQLFMLLHGAYGNLFLQKFCTGELDGNGKDRGVRSAMQVWQADLSAYPADVVYAAVKRASEASPKFPPSLPEFLAHCRASMPRVAYVDPDPVAHRLPAPAPVAGPVQFEVRKDGKDWARRILAEHAAGMPKTHGVLVSARAALGVVR